MGNLSCKQVQDIGLGFEILAVKNYSLSRTKVHCAFNGNCLAPGLQKSSLQVCRDVFSNIARRIGYRDEALKTGCCAANGPCNIFLLSLDKKVFSLPRPTWPCYAKLVNSTSAPTLWESGQGLGVSIEWEY